VHTMTEACALSERARRARQAVEAGHQQDIAGFKRSDGAPKLRDHKTGQSACERRQGAAAAFQATSSRSSRCSKRSQRTSVHPFKTPPIGLALNHSSSATAP
jgi:hypothetical protein